MGREVELFHPHLVIIFINRSADIKIPALTRSKIYLGKPQKKKKHAFQREKGKYMEISFARNPRHFLRTHDFLFGTHDFFLGTHDFFLGTHDFLFGTHDFLPTTHDFLPTTHDFLPTTHDPRLFTHDPRHSTHDPRLLASPLLVKEWRDIL